VIAKSDRIEVWDLDKSGLVHRAELELWGNVIAIDKVEIAVSDISIWDVIFLPANNMDRVPDLTSSSSCPLPTPTSSSSRTPPPLLPP
jgi:hypothetical protein